MQLAGAGASSVVLPRGLGCGPGEINLLPLFVNSAASPSQFAPYLNAVLAGTGAYSGRYGGTPGSGVPGISGYVAPLTFNKWYNYAGVTAANGYWSTTASRAQTDAFGAPPDPRGYGAVGLDAAGRLLPLSMGSTVYNTPYDLNLSRNAARGLSYFVSRSSTTSSNDPLG